MLPTLSSGKICLLVLVCWYWVVLWYHPVCVYFGNVFCTVKMSIGSYRKLYNSPLFLCSQSVHIKATVVWISLLLSPAMKFKFIWKLAPKPFYLNKGSEVLHWLSAQGCISLHKWSSTGINHHASTDMDLPSCCAGPKQQILDLDRVLDA